MQTFKLESGERNATAYEGVISTSVVYCGLWNPINLHDDASALLAGAQPLQLAAVVKEGEK